MTEIDLPDPTGEMHDDDGSRIAAARRNGPLPGGPGPSARELITDGVPGAAPMIGPAGVRRTARAEAVASVLADPEVPGQGWVPAGGDRTIVATTLRATYVQRAQGKAWELDAIAVTGNRLRRTGVPGTTTDTVRSDVLADFPDWIQTWVREQRPSIPERERFTADDLNRERG